MCKHKLAAIYARSPHTKPLPHCRRHAVLFDGEIQLDHRPSYLPDADRLVAIPQDETRAGNGFCYYRTPSYVSWRLV
jgi:hypothetical protein